MAATRSCISITSFSSLRTVGGLHCRDGLPKEQLVRTARHVMLPFLRLTHTLQQNCSRRGQRVFVKRAARLPVRALGNGDVSDSEWRVGGSDGYGLYPWEQTNSSDEDSGQGEDWVREPVITLLTAQGVVQLGGERVPARRAQAWQRRQSGKVGRLRVFREDAYMNPQQRLCLGATFDIHATNGLDLGRRLTVLGFCRSVAMLNDVVEDMVTDQGGQVVHADLENPSGLHERLVMTVHVPMLWGVPPQLDSLKHAIRSGGGIVQKTYRQWKFL